MLCSKEEGGGCGGCEVEEGVIIVFADVSKLEAKTLLSPAVLWTRSDRFIEL
jgi:hypothetical protein